MTCGRLDQVVAAAVWGCVADTYPSYHMVMAQYDGAGRLAYLDAVVDRQSLDARRYDAKAEARRLFTAAVRASFDEDRADRVLSWATARIGAERTTATIGELHLTMDSDRAPDDAILKVRRGRAMPADTLVPLPHASTTTGRPYFEKRGYTCRGGDLGTIECELGRPGFKGSAVMWPIARTSAVSDLSFGITAGDDYPRGDVRERIRREFPPVLGMVFRGDDARRASSWTLAHLGKEQHMALIDGVLIELGPVAPGDWAPGRIYGMGFKLSTMTWV
jgi:hypothetical protein